MARHGRDMAVLLGCFLLTAALLHAAGWGLRLVLPHALQKAANPIWVDGAMALMGFGLGGGGLAVLAWLGLRVAQALRGR